MGDREKIYCIFSNEKESFYIQIEKAFKEYLKNTISDNKYQGIEHLEDIRGTNKLNVKQLKDEKELEAQKQKLYNNMADDC